MVSMLVSSVVDHGFKPRSGQIKDYEISICCFSAKQSTVSRTKSKDWLARNQVNVSTVLTLFSIDFFKFSMVLQSHFLEGTV
jgi:hypothetical protein